MLRIVIDFNNFIESGGLNKKSPPSGGDWLSLRIEVLKISNRSREKTQTGEDVTAWG
ncbi:hypothetical protein SPLC1_S630110 [Arthrospira platensis C1]|nr:hypothetical protein SPLC1_S630110 [Arthrospira platensis C1]